MAFLITVYFILGTMVEVEYTASDVGPLERKITVILLRIFWPIALLISKDDE